MISRMLNELCRIQEHYGDYLHNGNGVTRRKETKEERKIRQAKHDALEELWKAWHSVWMESEGYGKVFPLTYSDFLLLRDAKAMIDPKDGDVYFDYNGRHFDTMGELIAANPSENKRLIDADECVDYLMNAMDLIDEDGNRVTGRAKRKVIQGLVDGMTEVAR